MQILSLIFLCCPITLIAQNRYTIIYELYVSHQQINKVSKLQLAINDSISYQAMIQHFNGEKYKLKEPLGSKFISHSIYTNKNKRIKLTQSHPYGRSKYLIVDTIKKYNWIIGDETKEIVGYICKKAMVKDDDNFITAWFAPSLQLDHGPNHLSGLPELILELHYSPENSRFVAIEPAKSSRYCST